MRWLPTDNTTSTTAAGVFVVEAVCATATATRDDEVIDLRPSDRREGAATSSPPENLTKLPIERDVLGDRRAAGRGGDLRCGTAARPCVKDAFVKDGGIENGHLDVRLVVDFTD
jgi:hypothetical protein